MVQTVEERRVKNGEYMRQARTREPSGLAIKRPIEPEFKRSYPLTCDWLKQLQPGQRLIYYRGSFGDDIGRSKATYAEILRKVNATALALEAEGKIRLEQTEIELDAWGSRPRAKLCEYTAIGIEKEKKKESPSQAEGHLSLNYPIENGA